MYRIEKSLWGEQEAGLGTGGQGPGARPWGTRDTPCARGCPCSRWPGLNPEEEMWGLRISFPEMGSPQAGWAGSATQCQVAGGILVSRNLPWGRLGERQWGQDGSGALACRAAPSAQRCLCSPCPLGCSSAGLLRNLAGRGYGHCKQMPRRQGWEAVYSMPVLPRPGRLEGTLQLHSKPCEPNSGCTRGKQSREGHAPGLLLTGPLRQKSLLLSLSGRDSCCLMASRKASSFASFFWFRASYSSLFLMIRCTMRSVVRSFPLSI